MLPLTAQQLHALRLLAIGVLIGVLLMLAISPQAGAQDFNQCAAGGLSDCDHPGPLEDDFYTIGLPFNEGDTFTTVFDIAGNLQGFGCRWIIDAYYPEACVTPIFTAQNYIEDHGDVECVTASVNPPAGIPNENTGRLRCEAIDTDLGDIYPLNFAPTFGDYVHTWEVIDGCDPEGEEIMISPGDWTYYREFFEGQCLPNSSPTRMRTRIPVLIPEPPILDGFIGGITALLLVSLVRKFGRTN